MRKWVWSLRYCQCSTYYFPQRSVDRLHSGTIFSTPLIGQDRGSNFIFFLFSRKREYFTTLNSEGWLRVGGGWLPPCWFSSVSQINRRPDSRWFFRVGKVHNFPVEMDLLSSGCLGLIFPLFTHKTDIHKDTFLSLTGAGCESSYILKYQTFCAHSVHSLV